MWINRYTLFIICLNLDGLRYFVKKLLSREMGNKTRNVKKLFHKQGEYEELCLIHYSAGYTLSMFYVWHFFRRLFAKNKTKRESAWITVYTLCVCHVFSYFCVAFHRMSIILRVRTASCANLTWRHEMRNVIYEKPAKTALYTSSPPLSVVPWRGGEA